MADRNLGPVFNSCLRNPIYMRRGYVELFTQGDHHAMPARVPICNSKTQILQHLAFQLAQNAGAFSASRCMNLGMISPSAVTTSILKSRYPFCGAFSI